MKEKFWDHTKKLYIGPHDRTIIKTVDGICQPYRAFYNQKRRTGVLYSFRELIYWYYFHPMRGKLVSPHIARIDHSKKYSLDNIILQEASENVKERNYRRGLPGKTHKKVVALDLQTREKIKEFNSIRKAAEYFRVNPCTITNHCNKVSNLKYAHFSKNPPYRKITFIWK